MNLRALLAGLLATLYATSALAADGVQISGSVRLRYEEIGAQPRPAYNEDDQLLLARTFLQARYTQGSWRWVAELQDSRAWWGDSKTLLGTTEVNAVELSQAYIAHDLDGVLGKDSRVALQAGRFSMSLGSRRLVAAEDFRNTTTSMTGLRADWQWASTAGGTAFVTFPSTRLPDTQDALLNNGVKADRESLDTLWYGTQLRSSPTVGGGVAELLLLGLRDRDAPGRPSKDRDLRTVDLRLIREPAAGHWDWDLEGALQWGHASSSTAATAVRREVAANYLHLRTGYQWNLPWKPRLAVDYDWASGDGSGPVSHRFDTLYGGRRADFAPAGLYALLGRSNINTPGLRMEVTPSARLDVMATVRGLWLASAVDAFSTTGIRDATGASGSYAGTQWDSRVRYWLIPKRMQLEVNALLLKHGQFLQQAPGARRESATRFLTVSVMTSF
jgi:hypothetical protein